MLKKALIGTGIAVALGAFVFGRDMFSYAKTAAVSARNAVKAEVPLEFEVERAREMVESLVPEIRKSMHVIAEQQVDIEHLTRGISEKEAALAKQKQEILALRSALDSGDSTYRFASKTYTSDEVRRDLSLRFERFKMAEESLAREHQILRAREKALVANTEKLDGMLAAKQDLQVKVEQIEARLKTLQAAETVSTISFDDSQLARTKKLIAELDKQLDVRTRVLDADGKFTGLIEIDARVDVPGAATLMEDIDAYFSQEKPTAPKVIELDPAA